MNFDLISDLHLEPNEPFDWSGKATSLYCIIAGNISYDRNTLYKTLEHLSNHYEMILFVDGMLEHKEWQHLSVEDSYLDLRANLDKFENIFFMHDNIIIINGIGFLGANGWCTYDFDPNLQADTMEFLLQTEKMSSIDIGNVLAMANSDTHYFKNSISECQTIPDISEIIMITNSVPLPDLISHDINLSTEYMINRIGNNGITSCLDEDHEGKISTWCFGKYPGDMDMLIHGVRYLNNTACSKPKEIYHPKRITI